MKNRIVFPVLLALIAILSSCEKEEERVYILENTIPPEFVTVPAVLDLKRDNASDTMLFSGTMIDPGYQASVKYLVQVRPAGDVDAKPSSIFSSIQDTLLKRSVSDLNVDLKAKVPKAYIPTDLDFIIKAILVSSAGDGAEVHEFISAPVTITVTRYDPPRLDVIDADGTQKLPLEEGVYAAMLEFIQNQSFTLYDPESDITYGGSNGVLAVDGPAIVPPFDGDYRLEVDTTSMTYELTRISSALMTISDGENDQEINSPTGDGIYSGIIAMDPAKPITCLEIDTDITYGGSDDVLIADGAAIESTEAGWHMLTVNVNDMSYSLEPYQVGVVGAFTDWGTDPDIPMDYNPKKGIWFVDELDLPTGPMKFRLNSAWDIRWGPGVNTDLPENGGTMELPNSDADINITAAGNYSIELKIFTETTGSAKFTLN